MAIALVLAKFRETWSIRQTFKWFHEQGIELPVNKSVGGRFEIVFQLPTHSFIGHVLRNPIYAGAYVYGCRPTELKLIDGRPLKRLGRRRPPTEARVDRRGLSIARSHRALQHRVVGRVSSRIITRAISTGRRTRRTAG